MQNMFVSVLLKSFFVFMLVGAVMNSTASAAVRKVPNDYSTISGAITAASDGDTIRVFSGTYAEHVNVSKSLVLLGSGPDTATTTIIAPADFETNSAYDYPRATFITERTIVHIGGTHVLNVEMKGFSIDGNRVGPSSSQGVAYSGVLAERTNLIFSGNAIQNVLPADSSQTYNTIYNGRGITVRGDSSVATISSNSFQQINRLHIYVNATDTTTNVPAVFPIATVSSNTITGKGLYNGAQKGIWFNNGAWGTISGNIITNMDYIDPVIESDRATAITIRRGYLNPTKRNLILSNTVTTSSHTNNKGVFAEGQNDSIADNTVSGFRFGIQLDDQDAAFVVRNTVTGGQIGVMVSTTTIAPVAPYVITIGGSPSNKNTITGQDTGSVGAAIALSFRDPVADGTFMSTVPVDARYNDLGAYSESEIQRRIWDRADTTLAGVDTVLYTPFYTPKLRASVRVFLQGPYLVSGDSMAKTLKTSGVLAGHFGSALIPDQAVDSVNIELRNSVSAAGSTIRKSAPAWLLTDGTIRSFADTTKQYVEFDTTISGNYYIVIRHRNHLSVLSSRSHSIDGSVIPAAYNFTDSLAKAYSTTPMKAVGSFFAMIAGDADANLGIGASDLVGERAAIGVLAYVGNDVDMNGGVGASDIVLSRANIGQTSQVP